MTTYGSVCSGIEAASVAWEPLGWKSAWLAEIEPFPCGALAHHYPSVPNLGDFTLIRSAIADGSVEAPDILVGGTPCQAFSVAGLRQSMDDARGQLTLEFVRLADAIDSARIIRGLAPAVVVWENVPGVLNAPDNAFGCFLAGLAGEDDPLEPPGGRWTNSGHVRGPARTIAWRILDAQYFGVAQRRRRVFVVASAGTVDPSTVLFERDGVRRDSPPSREAGKAAPTLPSRSSAGDGLGTGFERAGEARGQDPVVACFGGNNTTGPVDVATARNACASTSGRLDFESGTFVAACATGDVFHTLRAEGFDASEDGTGRGGGAVAVAHVEILPTMTSGGPKDTSHGQISGQMRDAYMVPVLGFNAWQDPDSWEGRTGPLDTDPGTQSVGVLAIRGRSDGSSLEARYDGAANAILTPSGGRAGIGVGAVHAGMQVRRLTPTECERLQGFPDGHTLIPWRGKPAELCPDGPRYKALGNSMAVPVMRWIGQRIDLHLRVKPLAFPPPGA